MLQLQFPGRAQEGWIPSVSGRQKTQGSLQILLPILSCFTFISSTTGTFKHSLAVRT